MTPLVYLDSQDYSKLAERPELLAELTAIRDNGQAIFVYSSAIISECAPTTPSATRHAVDRSRVISHLCGRKTFISIDQIIDKEFSCLDRKPLSRSDLISENGDWFPRVDSLLSEIDRAAIMNETIRDRNLNRKARRTVTSKMMRKGEIRKSTSGAILDSNETFEEIIGKYPMHPKNAEVLMSYVAGTATNKRAERALLESLRDHQWMMQWFHQHHDRLSFVPSFIRKPSTTMLERMKNTVDLSNSQGFPASEWHRFVDNIILKLGTDYAKDHHVVSSVTVSKIHQHCPGFATLIQTIREITKDSMGQSTRRLKGSDFADAIHTLHAPYVDIFRTDVYMARKVSLSTGLETTICPKLEQLPDAISIWSART